MYFGKSLGFLFYVSGGCLGICMVNLLLLTPLTYIFFYVIKSIQQIYADTLS